MTCKLSKQQLRILADSDEFQKIIAADPVLDRLEALQYDEPAEILNLQPQSSSMILPGP